MAVMNSMSFGSIVSPRGVAPTASPAPTRLPRGGLSSLIGNPVAAPAAPSITTSAKTGAGFRMPHMHHPRLLSMAMGHGLKKSAGYKQGGAVSALERAKAKLGKASKTIDMVEKGRVVVRHQFFGKNAKEASHMMRSHEKADASLRDAMQGKKYKGIDIKAVKRARGGRIGYADGGAMQDYQGSSAALPGELGSGNPTDEQSRIMEVLGIENPVTAAAMRFRDPMGQARVRMGHMMALRGNGRINFDDGGSVDDPSFNDYMASGAAPDGLSADAYRSDYQNYLNEIGQAKNAVTGRATPFLPGQDMLKAVAHRDFPSASDADVDSFIKNPDIRAGIQEKRTRDLGLSLGSGLWNAVPYLPFIGPVGKGLKALGAAAVATDYLPGIPDWSELPKYAGVPIDDPAWKGSGDFVKGIADVATLPMLAKAFWPYRKKIAGALAAGAVAGSEASGSK